MNQIGIKLDALDEIDNDVGGGKVVDEENNENDDDDDEMSLEIGNLEENLEKLLEKYAHLGSEIEAEKNLISELDEDETDYYSLKIGKRPAPFELELVSPPSAAPTVVFTPENTKTMLNGSGKAEASPPLHRVEESRQLRARAADLETSLVEMGRGLNETIGSSASTRLSKADLSKIYTELNDIHQRLFVSLNLKFKL